MHTQPRSLEDGRYVCLSRAEWTCTPGETIKSPHFAQPEASTMWTIPLKKKENCNRYTISQIRSIHKLPAAQDGELLGAPASTGDAPERVKSQALVQSRANRFNQLVREMKAGKWRKETTEFLNN